MTGIATIWHQYAALPSKVLYISMLPFPLPYCSSVCCPSLYRIVHQYAALPSTVLYISMLPFPLPYCASVCCPSLYVLFISMLPFPLPYCASVCFPSLYVLFISMLPFPLPYCASVCCPSLYRIVHQYAALPSTVLCRLDRKGNRPDYWSTKYRRQPHVVHTKADRPYNHIPWDGVHTNCHMPHAERNTSYQKAHTVYYNYTVQLCSLN